MRWQARTAEDMERFGGLLAAAMLPEMPLGVVYLVGDLGAGKTTLSRGFLRACGVTGLVRSPTYTLMEVYETPGLSILHLDLYRLLDPSELETLGLREWARAGHTWLVEWPERGAGWLPPADLSLRLSIGDEGHAIDVVTGTPLGEVWLSRLADSQPRPP